MPIALDSPLKRSDWNQRKDIFICTYETRVGHLYRPIRDKNLPEFFGLELCSDAGVRFSWKGN